MCLCVFRFGKDRTSAAAWEWGYLQISLWDYWSVLFRGWCKYFSSRSSSLACLPVTVTSVFYRLMKIPLWSQTHKAGPSTLIRPPTCRQKNSISRGRDVGFEQLLGYSDISPRHSSISPIWYRRIYFASRQKEISTLKDLFTPATAHGVFFFPFFFFSVINFNGHPSLYKWRP